ncbi:MAG: hypothetical protein CL928_18055 [Deltaproteobacteria bacterium]|nr:hypothetical protein [Deltaproteobacteria bacterium]
MHHRAQQQHAHSHEQKSLVEAHPSDQQEQGPSDREDKDHLASRVISQRERQQAVDGGIVPPMPQVGAKRSQRQSAVEGEGQGNCSHHSSSEPYTQESPPPPAVTNESSHHEHSGHGPQELEGEREPPDRPGAEAAGPQQAQD